MTSAWKALVLTAKVVDYYDGAEQRQVVQICLNDHVIHTLQEDSEFIFYDSANYKIDIERSVAAWLQDRVGDRLEKDD